MQEFGGEWGYNPRLLMSVHSKYGTCEQLCYFVDACHQKGMAVCPPGEHKERKEEKKDEEEEEEDIVRERTEEDNEEKEIVQTNSQAPVVLLLLLRLFFPSFFGLSFPCAVYLCIKKIQEKKKRGREHRLRERGLDSLCIFLVGRPVALSVLTLGLQKDVRCMYTS